MQQFALEAKGCVLTRMAVVRGLQTTVALIVGVPVHAFPLNPLEVSPENYFCHLFLPPQWISLLIVL